jgi:hypothetical protein
MITAITNQSTYKNITQLSIGTNSRNSTIAFVPSHLFYDVVATAAVTCIADITFSRAHSPIQSIH